MTTENASDKSGPSLTAADLADLNTLRVDEATFRAILQSLESKSEQGQNAGIARLMSARLPWSMGIPDRESSS